MIERISRRKLTAFQTFKKRLCEEISNSPAWNDLRYRLQRAVEEIDKNYKDYKKR